MEDRIDREREFHDHAFSEDIRQPLWKYYEILDKSERKYEKLLLKGCEGKNVLECGCGRNTKGLKLAQRGATLTCIDISPVAIEQSVQTATEMGVLDRTTYHVMNAESLEFPDNTFDLVCGRAVIHHLDLAAAYKEFARVLKPSGRAVFYEPLGHNPVINWFRNRTASARTPDEHPLLRSDFVLARESFGRVRVRFYTLFGLAAVPFRNTPFFRPLLKALDLIDSLIFKIPGARYWAWMSVIVLSNPKK